MLCFKTLLVVTLLFFLSPFPSNAQNDSSTHIKYKSSVYDPSSIFYNKEKIAFNIGIGTLSYIETQIYYLYGSPDYLANESIGPVYNASFDYGITFKSAIGMGVTYQEVTNSNSTIYTKVKEINEGFRFTHGFGTWEFLYYGFRLGMSEWSYVLNNASGSHVISSFSDSPNDPTVQLLLGARLTFSKYLFLHFEGGIFAPYTFEGGISYRINTEW